jgi:hypothetical protein
MAFSSVSTLAMTVPFLMNTPTYENNARNAWRADGRIAAMRRKCRNIGFAADKIVADPPIAVGLYAREDWSVVTGACPGEQRGALAILPAIR